MITVEVSIEGVKEVHTFESDKKCFDFLTNLEKSLNDDAYLKAGIQPPKIHKGFAVPKYDLCNRNVLTKKQRAYNETLLKVFRYRKSLSIKIFN